MHLLLNKDAFVRHTNLLLNPDVFVGMTFAANLRGSTDSFLNQIYANNSRGDLLKLLASTPSTEWRDAIEKNNP